MYEAPRQIPAVPPPPLPPLPPPDAFGTGVCDSCERSFPAADAHTRLVRLVTRVGNDVVSTERREACVCPECAAARRWPAEIESRSAAVRARYAEDLGQADPGRPERNEPIEEPTAR